MASKVNTKFIVLLSAGLIGLVGLVGAALFVFGKNSASDLIARGDSELAKGSPRMAAEYYSRAVNKEQTNVVYINKWREALKAYAPDDITRFAESYRNLVVATRQVGTVQKTNVDAQREYLEILRTDMEADDASRQSLDNMIRETEVFLKYYENEPKDGKWNTLRRFRGLSVVQIMAGTPDLKPDFVAQGRDDLVAAIAADPSDVDSAVALEAWYEIQRSRFDAVTQTAEITDFEAKSRAVIDAALLANPNDAMAMLAKVRREFTTVDVNLRANPPADRSAAIAIINVARDAARPQLDAAAAAMKAVPGGVKYSKVLRLRQLEQIIDPQSQNSRTEEVLRAALDADPENSDYLLMMADVLADRLQFADSIASVQRIIDAKPKTISHEGYALFDRRKRAVFLQALWGVKNWEQIKEDKEKADAIAFARERFERLKKIDEPESAQIALVSAYLAYVDQKYPEANRAIDQYNTKVKNRNPDALWLKAVISEQVREPGASKRALEELLRIRPSDLRGILALARVEASLGNNARAEELVDSILRILPEFAPAKELKERLSLLGGVGTSDDPVVNAITEIDRLDQTSAEATDPKRDEKVMALIDAKAVQFPTDARIAQIRAIQNVRMNRRDEARRVIEESLKLNPDSATLKNYLIIVNNPDPVKQGEALIDADTRLNDLERAIAKFQMYQNNGRREPAAEQLNLAIAAAPDDPRVIELQFMRSLEIQDFASAQVAVDRAVAANLDKVGGAAFRARLMSARGQPNEGIVVLEQAIGKGGAAPELWRLMGRIQNSAGRQADAVRSFREAVTLRPGDIPTVIDLVQTLVSAGRGVEALETCKEFEKFAGGDAAFLETYLVLEARHGDKAKAIERRRRIAKSSPDNRRNAMELAALLTDEKQFDDAKKLIDTIRTTRDGVDVAGLDASWYWTQGRRDEGKAVFEALLDKPLGGEPAGVGPYLTYAGFLADRGFIEDAVAVLKRARPKQDPKIVEADRALSDLYFFANDFPAAGAAARRVADAGSDDKGIYRQRLAESLNREGKFAEAEKELNSISAGKEPEMITMLLLAESKAGQGDSKAARTLLDTAVARHQTEANVFIKRGQFLLSQEGRGRDALADFAAAVRLQPDSWQALRLRAAAYVALGDVNAALADLRSAVKIAPGNDELVLGLVSDLIRSEKYDEASAVADEVLAVRKTDANLMRIFGDLFARYRRWPAAARLHGLAFELDKQDGIAQRYLDSLLSKSPPDIARAESVLSELDEARIAKTPGFLMAFARVRSLQGRLPEADRFAIEGVKILDPTNPQLMIAWFNDVQKLQSDPAKIIRFLDAVTDARIAPDWMAFFKAGVLTADPSTSEKGMIILADLVKSSPIEAVKKLSYRQQGNTFFAAGKNAEAAKVWEEAVTAYDNDFESANNLAYVYVKFLNRPNDALPLARRAAAGIPNSADVLDTLGLAEHGSGLSTDAIATLKRAWLLADSAQSRMTVGTHLARIFGETKQIDEAKDLIRTLDDLLSRVGPDEITPEIKADFAAVKETIPKQ